MAYDFITKTGVIVADTAAVQSEIETEYQADFGSDLDLAPGTTQGILISAETTSRVGIATNNAQLANQINPNIAGGVYLDGIWALTGGVRQAASSSFFVSSSVLQGTPNATIFAPIVCVNANGDLFISSVNAVLNAFGLGSAPFIAVEKGPIACPSGELEISVSQPGWDTVDNIVDATLGLVDQSDISARAERNLTLGLQGSGVSVSIFANTFSVTGVTSLVYLENVANIATTIDGVNLLDPHSIWACVDGGNELEVATALLASKGAGAGWNNGKAGASVSQNVVDPISGQVYNVLFDRPTDVAVKLEITIAPTSISNAQDIVKGALLAYAAGELDGQEGFVGGADVSPFEAAGAVNIVEPGLVVTLARAAKTGDAFATATVAIAKTERASLIEGNITVIIV